MAWVDMMLCQEWVKNIEVFYKRKTVLAHKHKNKNKVR